MQRSSHTLSRLGVVFDDDKAVARGGLLLPITLAEQLGLRELIDASVDLRDSPYQQLGAMESRFLGDVRPPQTPKRLRSGGARSTRRLTASTSVACTRPVGPTISQSFTGGALRSGEDD